MTHFFSGVYEEIQGITKLRECIVECCFKETCNVIFMSENKCYHVSCKSNDLCVPMVNTNPDASEHSTLVLVRPTDDESWEDVLRQHGKDLKFFLVSCTFITTCSIF